MNFYSQQGEDVYVYHNFINRENPEGVFVELGGFDGITYSNSKFFEDTLYFKGVLIEPTPQFQTMIQERPKCMNYNLAVAGSKQMMLMTGDTATAALDSLMDPAFRDAHHQNSTSYLVEAMPFRDILKSSGITRIDLLTIDVEGGERVVLETMDFSIPTYVVIVEVSKHNAVDEEACRVILRNNGFIFDRGVCANEIWFNPNYPFIDSVYSPKPQVVFTSIIELGNFPCLEHHCVPDVEKALRLGRRV